MMENISARIEKRNRPPVSCEPCRGRKSKCNRALPCDSCMKRGQETSCRYAANAHRGTAASLPAKSRAFKDRLDSLEQLVNSLASQDPVDVKFHSPDSGVSVAKSTQSLAYKAPRLQETDNGQLNYIDPSHWQSILEDIREVREHLSPSNTSPSHGELRSESIDPPAVPDAGFLFGKASDISIEKVLNVLPAQPICDMLLSWFFNARYMILGIVHPVKFQNEYKIFWESPTTAPPLWIGLLFSILSLTVTLRKLANPDVDTTSVPSAADLQNATVQCLLLGKYATANSFALETFILHLQSSFLTRGREPVDFWFEMGVIIRLAFRCGYHRDPGTLTNLSPFDGEMRRRVWLNIVQIDALMSFQMGFPSMIPAQFCDTKDPLNLQHADLRMDMTELPPARPLAENTPVTYIIAKSSVMRVFRKIVESTQSLTVPPYSETSALNSEMRRVYGNLPEQYQPRDIGYAFTDSAVLILERCTIELLHLKGIIILLRQFISYEVDDAIHKSLRHECVDAALAILARQADVNRACESGGRLYEDRWIMASLSANDYLLAAMVVCRHLSVTMRCENVTSAEDRDFAQRQYRALQTAHRIFSLQAGQSRDMRLATEAIDLMLRKVAEKDHGALVVEPPSAGVDGFAMEGLQPWHADTISQMIDGSDVIDWSILDQYFPEASTSNTDWTWELK